MEYEMLHAREKRTMIETNLRNLETQHFQKCLDRLANSGNPAGQRQLDEELALRAAGIQALREELAKYPLPAEPPANTDAPDPDPQT